MSQRHQTLLDRSKAASKAPAQTSGSASLNAKRRRPDRPLTAEELRRRVQAVQEQFVERDDLPEKVLLQQEMGRMRRLLQADRRKVSVTYPVNPPFAFIHLRFDADAGEFRYEVKEPALTEGEREILPDLRSKMEAMADHDDVPKVSLTDRAVSPAIQGYLHDKFLDVIDLYDFQIEGPRRRALFYYLQRDLVGFGRPDAVLRDPFVEDVSCNGSGVPIYVFHRVFGSVRTNVLFKEDTELNRYILQLAQVSGKHVSVFQPILDATLQDGSRINLTLGTEVTKKGSTFSIRKFNHDPITPVDLIRLGSTSVGLTAYLWQLIDAKRSVLVSGGTASGKTTLLNALSMFMRGEDKIVSIEDTPEVHLAQENWIQSVSRAGYGTGGKAGGSSGTISLFDLLVAALRQRPEYILVGEVRGKEATTLFQAISTGHAAMATIHAASVEELLNRIENEPMNIPRALIQSLDAVVFPAQVTRQGSRLRRVVGVTEILDLDGQSKNLLTNDVFEWDAKEDAHRFGGRSFVLESLGLTSGLSLEEVEAEVERKQRYLELLLAQGLNHYTDFTRAINDYYVSPQEAFMRYDQQFNGR